MLRLPNFHYHAPATVEEAAALKAEHGRLASFVAGGTDLYPNMKRRLQQPHHVIDIARLGELRGIRREEDGSIRIGAATPLEEVAASDDVRRSYPALADAAGLVATAPIRRMGTIGGNLCLDTRCLFYNQSYEWRKGIDFCMKVDGHICRVAESSPKCVAASSTDTAPVAVALGAAIELKSASGARSVPAASFYQDDGIRYLAKRDDELLTALRLPPAGGAVCSYVKLRRRNSFDFPILGVAAWLRREGPASPVMEARIVLGAVFPDPREIPAAAAALLGRPLDADAIAAAADAAHRAAKPLDNTDGALSYRKEMVRAFTRRALQKLAG